ncbi:efflux RND transporter periplasmic adaptor subunit [Haliangium sp.]|uniref:efflux RND transporter periplasmic adaptor subunit n=1 Tax=Haliangium sp. TaxID=2663208 RepID=UPI003D1462E3
MGSAPMWRWAPALALALAVGGCGEPEQAASEAARADGGPAQPAATVTATGERGYVAVITAREATDVAAELAGRVKAVHVTLGDHIDAGQLMAELDDRPVREALTIAQANQRAARAALDQARVEVDEAARRLETERALMARGTTSQAELDNATFAHEKALAARARVEAELAEKGAQVTTLQSRLAQTRVTAPYAGTVSVRYLDPGAIVSAGTPLIRLIASDELWVKFAVPSQDSQRVAVGQRVAVDIEPAALTVDAVVRHVAPALEPASQMIFAEAELVLGDDHSAQVKAGQAARVRPPARAAARPSAPPAE